MIGGDSRKYPSRQVRAAIVEALEVEGGHDPVIAGEIAFHMTDWLDDLARWDAFCTDPEAFPADEVNRLLVEFLAHVPAHLAAAAKLHLDLPVTDVFGVGAVDCDGGRGP